MLIQRGKEEGWLHLDASAITTWAKANGIKFINASPRVVPGRGIGLVADHNLENEDGSGPVKILQIAEDLVLSGEAVKKHAQFDKDFREILESLGDFGRSNLMGHATPRGSILCFLLFQASISCPDLSERIGVHSAFTDYIKTLPRELLPTFWRSEELRLLVGTTLAPAISSKLKSLRREYDLLCDSAANTWWYGIVEPYLDFEDWLHVDAMFRSRALDFYGSCMIPGMDLASHAAGERTNAFYDRADGQYYLFLNGDKQLSAGDEVTITYGDEKGACEMMFSYGFLEDCMDTAETLFLSLTIPENDIARLAKSQIAQCAPGFKLIDVTNRGAVPAISDGDDDGTLQSSGDIDWKGDFIWLLCVDQADGLTFELARTIDGEGEEVQATFRGQELKSGAGDLRRLLAQSELWDVYRLRAVVILQQRVYDQLQVLFGTQEQVEAMPHGNDKDIRDLPYQLAMKLRRLEFELLEKAYEDFEKQKVELADSPVVQQYLSQVNADQAPEDNFA